MDKSHLSDEMMVEEGEMDYTPVGGFSNDGTDVDGAVDIEETEDGEDIVVDVSKYTITSHTDAVYTVAVNPVNHSIVATGGGDDVARIFQYQLTEDNEQIIEKFTLSGHEDSVVDMAFSNDGKLLATAGYDACVKIWDTTTGALVQSLTGPADSIEWIQWHKKGNVILGGSADATAWMWLATTGACMQVFAGHEDGISCGSFSGSGKMVVTGSFDGSVKTWNPKTGECLNTFRVGSHGWHTEGIVTLAVHPTKPLVITGSQDGSARVCQIQHNKVIAIFSHKPELKSHEIDERNKSDDMIYDSIYGIEAVGFSPVFNYAASASMDGFLKIWDLGNNACRHTCKHPAGVIKLKWHTKQPWIVTACADAMLRVWDARNGELLNEMGGHSDVILAMDAVFEADDSITILSGSDDNTARIFRV